MTNNNTDKRTLNISKKHFKIVAILLAILIAACFIPSEKEVSMPEHEYSVDYGEAISYKYIGYKTNTGCLDDAYDSAHGDRELYDEQASKCKGINTNETIEVIRLSNGRCNARYDYSAHMVVDDCDIFYIKNGKLYSNLRLEATGSGKYKQSYSSEVTLKVLSGNSLSVENYYTVDCHAFGLICAKADRFEEGTNFRTRLKIGNNVKIKKYNSVCDGTKEMIDDETCVNSGDTYSLVTINQLIK